MFTKRRCNVDCKQKLDRRETGLRLYRCIARSGRTNSEIAEFLELTTPRVLYEWMNGTKMPSLENLYNLARLLNVRIEDILA